METLFIGKSTIFLSETPSTNSYAVDLLKNTNPSEGTVIHTPNQTQGKGQRGSVWSSDPASNLTVSFILKPRFLEIQNQFFLYQISALTCYDTMAELLSDRHFDIKIKWPNVILVNKKKIAGILIENNVLNGQISWSVVGIGINVNQTRFDTNIHATSLKLLQSEKVFDVSEVLKKLCVYLEKYYLALKNNRLNFIKEIYLSHLYGLNSFLDFEIKGETKSCLVKGVGEKGLLLLEDDNGKVLEADVKDMKWKFWFFWRRYTVKKL